jgi:hypothetical protein
VMLAASVVIALVVGWLAGMLTRERSSHWCPADGARLSCPECAKAGLHVLDNGVGSRDACLINPSRRSWTLGRLR